NIEPLRPRNLFSTAEIAEERRETKMLDAIRISLSLFVSARLSELRGLGDWNVKMLTTSSSYGHWLVACLSVLLVRLGPAQVWAQTGERLLSAHANDDGSRAEGKDSKQDDTSALRKALAEGPGVVRIGSGFYRWGDVEIPAGVTVVG